MRPEKIIRILKFFGDLTCTWPPDNNNVKSLRMVPDLKLWCVVITLIGVLIPIWCAVYHNRYNTGLAMKTLTETLALTDFVVKIFLCRLQRNRLRVKYLVILYYLEY